MRAMAARCWLVLSGGVDVRVDVEVGSVLEGGEQVEASTFGSVCSKGWASGAPMGRLVLLASLATSSEGMCAFGVPGREGVRGRPRSSLRICWLEGVPGRLMGGVGGMSPVMSAMTCMARERSFMAATGSIVATESSGPGMEGSSTLGCSFGLICGITPGSAEGLGAGGKGVCCSALSWFALSPLLSRFSRSSSCGLSIQSDYVAHRR